MATDYSKVSSGMVNPGAAVGTATVAPRVVVGKTSTLELSVRLSNGQVYATSLALTRLK